MRAESVVMKRLVARRTAEIEKDLDYGANAGDFVDQDVENSQRDTITEMMIERQRAKGMPQEQLEQFESDRLEASLDREMAELRRTGY